MRAERLLSIMLRLQERKKVTARELAKELGVSTRTIYRDMDALSLSGIPIYTQRGEDGGCFLDEAYRVSLTDLNLGELQSLFIMGGTQPLEALNIHQKVEDSLLKLLSSLPTHYQTQAKALQQRLYIDTKRWMQYEDETPFLNTLQSAVWNNQQIEAIYQSSDKTPRRIILQPYGLVVKTHIWYLVAWSVEHHAFRVYRASRFHQIAASNAHFERDSEFDLAKTWEQLSVNFQTHIAPTYTATVRLPNDLMYILDYYVANRYHIVEQIDGFSVVEIQFYNKNEAMPVMLGFGDRIDIIQPSELADRVVAYAQSIVDKAEKHKHDRQ